ncbi:AAEL005546-PA [Aedes aegypti]|uniref:AAEL005546-PA n=1 Tax=Aedes aegypti TaxID=7159 RepID=Q179R1_AEDAE|nr:AAEL005546-PA [Aedes aegypti]
MKFVSVVLLVLLSTILLSSSSAQDCIVISRCQPGNDGYLLPHYEDCNRYFRCEGGLACVQNCPTGLHFNAYHGVCEDPLTACCDIYLPCNPTR